MSVFKTNFDLLTKGVDSLFSERDYYHDMQTIVNNINFEDEKFNKNNLYKVKDYIHYYQNDWADGNPLEAEKGVKWRCRLAGPFRRMYVAINACRECNRLDLLNPIIEALNREGIHLTIDPKDHDIQDFTSELEAMDKIQTSICEEADDRTDSRDQAASAKQITKQAYNNTVRSLYKVELEKVKSRGDVEKATDTAKDKMSELYLESSMNADTYASAGNYLNDGTLE